MNYSETSRIVTLYTAELGKISALVRGARSTRHRFGSTLDPLAYIQTLLYIKPSRSLQTLTEANHIQTFPRIREELGRIEVGLRVVELANAVFHEREQNASAFALLVRVLAGLNHSGIHYPNLLGYYQVQMASLFGFSPIFKREDVELIQECGGFLDLQSGEILSRSGSSADVQPGSRSALRAFAVFARAPLEKVLQMSLRPEVEREVRALVESYLRYHFGDVYPERTSRVFTQFEPA